MLVGYHGHIKTWLTCQHYPGFACSLAPPPPPKTTRTTLHIPLLLPSLFSRVHFRERYRLTGRNLDQALFGFHGFWYVLYAKHTVCTVLLYLFYSTSNNIFIYLCARIFWIYYLVFLYNYWVIRLKYLLSGLFLINEKFHNNVTTQIL